MVLIRINVACEFLRKIFTKLKGHCFWVKFFVICVCVCLDLAAYNLICTKLNRQLFLVPENSI